MEKAAFLERLIELTSQEDVLAVSSEVNELKSKFQDFITEEERKRQIAHIEGEEHDDIHEDEIKEEFYQVYNSYRDKRTALLSSQKLEEEANLRKKKALIERLKTLITEEEKIGVAVAGYKEIHEEWKAIGDIPREKRHDIQNEYSKLLESFFHNLKIYRELKEHDLHRNSQLKRELVQRIKHLHEHESIKEIESAIKVLQNEFDEIGPVVNEEWEEIKHEYWEAVRAVYAKIHHFYEGKKQQLHENIERKRALLAEVKALVDKAGEANTIKDWENQTQQLLQFQNAWKEVGFGTKKENEELWHELRAVCNSFFDQKKKFFDTIREKQSGLVEAKKKIIEKAHAIKNSTDWKASTQQILKLQEDWKKIGHAGQKMEQVLWKEFRGACDTFFNAKQKHFEETEHEFEANLKAKQELIAKIEAFVPGENKQKTLEDLRHFSTEFMAIGKVPMKEKDNIYNAYKKALDAHYSKLKLEGEEKERAFFQAKLDTLKASPNSERLMDKERRELHQKIGNLKHEIIQFENNLGFFANSKGADILRKEVEQKIESAKKRIVEYQQKLKLLVHE